MRSTRLGITSSAATVAIKVVLEALAAESESIARLQREAQALAALNHPHIATLHGLEELAGRHFLVMEYMAGRTLADTIGGRGIPVPQTFAIARQIADALEAAHEKGDRPPRSEAGEHQDHAG